MGLLVSWLPSLILQKFLKKKMGSNAKENLLLCGYLREFQKSHKSIIPNEIVDKINLFSLEYLIYGNRKIHQN